MAKYKIQSPLNIPRDSKKWIIETNQIYDRDELYNENFIKYINANIIRATFLWWVQGNLQN